MEDEKMQELFEWFKMCREEELVEELDRIRNTIGGLKESLANVETIESLIVACLCSKQGLN